MKGNNYVNSGGHIGLPETVFAEIEQFVLQNGDEASLFLQPSYLKNFGKTLKAQQFVGVIETHSGIVIEILPKNSIAFALLFPLNRVFEDYVAHCLKKDFPLLTIEVQVRTEHLIEHPKREFLLKPDLKLGNSIIADTKWKLLDTSRNHSGISQADIYQMYAYGKKYLGTKEIHLIYPHTDTFPDITNSTYHFDKDGLKLRIFPFDCKEGRIKQYDDVLMGASVVSCSEVSKEATTIIDRDVDDFQVLEIQYS